MPLGDPGHLGGIESHQVAVLDYRTAIRNDSRKHHVKVTDDLVVWSGKAAAYAGVQESRPAVAQAPRVDPGRAPGVLI